LPFAIAEERVKIKVQPVFITIDPDRDTAKLIKSYIREFHPRMIGLRGNLEEVKKVAKLFRVYFMKTNDTKDYLVDHSIIMVRHSSSPAALQFLVCRQNGKWACLDCQVSVRPMQGYKKLHASGHAQGQCLSMSILHDVCMRSTVRQPAVLVHDVDYSCSRQDSMFA
jgi:hypothetical protein